MDLEKLEQDRATDPALQELDVLTLEELADRLREIHRYLVDPARGGPLAYLYRKQIERNRELQKELENARSQQRQRPPSRR